MQMQTSSPEETDTAVRRPALARWLGTTNDVTRHFLAAGRIQGLINMAGGLPAPELYPAVELAAIAQRAIEQHPQDTLGYGPIEGLPDLREALAARFATELRLRRDNVLITSSGMHGLDLLGKVLLEEGSLIAGQFPTYLGALDAWRPRNPTYRNLVLEEQGSIPSRRWRGLSSPIRCPISRTPRAGWWGSRCASFWSAPRMPPAPGSSRTTPMGRSIMTARPSRA
jgi:DNA-binding transcriptional MocR family regulator